MISRIIKVEVGVISRSRRLRLITLTEKSVSGVGAGFKSGQSETFHEEFAC